MPLLSPPGQLGPGATPPRFARFYPLASPSPYAELILSEPGLISYWRLDETTGLIVHDVANNNAGVYSVAPDAAAGVASTAGLLKADADSAIAFSLSQLANLTNNSSVQISTGSLECWVQTSQVNDGGYHGIVVKTNAFGLFQLNTGKLGFFDYGGGVNRDSGFAINDGGIHHLVLTFQSGVSNGTIIYFDGQAVLTTTMTIGDQTIAIYAATTNAAQALNGTVDEVALYNTVLTPTQVLNHYRTGTGGGPIIDTKGLSAGLPFSGSVIKRTLAPLPGSLSFTGTILRATIHTLQATSSFVGTTLKSTSRGLSGGLTFTGNILRLWTRFLVAAILSFSGGLVKNTTHPLTAALSFTGSVGKAISHILIATLSFTGLLLRATVFPLFAVLSFTGNMTRRTFYVLAGILSFAGSTTKFIATARTASLSFVGAMSKSLIRNLVAVLSFTGSITKQRAKLFLATLSFNGTVSRGITRIFGSTVSFIGTTAKLPSRSVTATLSFTGALIRGLFRQLVFSAGISFSGTITKRTIDVITGSVSFVGSILRFSVFPLQAALNFAGTTTKKTIRTLPGAVISFSSLFIVSLQIIISATLDFAGKTTKSVARILRSGLSFVGGLARMRSQVFVSALSFFGSVFSNSATQRLVDLLLSKVSIIRNFFLKSSSTELVSISEESYDVNDITRASHIQINKGKVIQRLATDDKQLMLEETTPEAITLSIKSETKQLVNTY